MHKSLLNVKRLERKQEQLVALETRSAEMVTRESEIEGRLDNVETDDDLAALEKEIDDLEADKEALEEEKTVLESEIDTLQKELERSNARKPKVRSKRSAQETDETLEEREAINSFVRAKGGPVERSFTSVEGGALIPEELLKPQVKPEDTVDLRKYVNVIPVTRGSGSYPVISKATGKMSKVGELEANPKLNNPSFVEVAWKIDTYRGYVPISEEVIDDADYDVVPLISSAIETQSLNTSNEEIAAVWKVATAVNVVGIDGWKDLLNTKIKKVYDVKQFISSSLYNEIDKLKDNNGRYLLQESISSPSGKVLFGKDVIVLDDDIIGEAEGDLVGFVGDSEAFTAYFDRKRTSVKWHDHHIYGQMLASFVRFDVEEADSDAGVYVTYTNAPADVVPEG